MSTTHSPSPLTDKQSRIYEFIRQQIRIRGFAPTIREIGKHFDIKSPNGVSCHLKALERKGLIRRESNTSRAIQLIGNTLRSSQEPVAV